VLVAVTVKAPFKIVGAYDLRLAARGTVFRKKFKIERNGYSGPLEVRLADKQARHLQGVTGPTLTVAADATEFEYPVTLPPWMETGRTARACVMVVGRVRDGGREHTVSNTSHEQNDQIIAVVETGQLGLELAGDTVAARPGGVVKVPFALSRGRGLKGAVKVELLPGPARGVSAAAVVVPAGERGGALAVRFAARPGPFAAPLVVRATLATAGGPVTAEAKLEVTAEE
jgi:hypothetical protein